MQSYLRYTLDLCLAASSPREPPPPTETSATKPIMAVFSAGENFSSLCHCEEQSDGAILVGRVRVEVAAPQLAAVRNNRKGKVARNDNITVPPPLRAEVRGKLSPDPSR